MSLLSLVLQADCRSLPLKDNVVDLTCTSPPYGLSVVYDPEQGGDILPEDWGRWLEECLREVWRVTKPCGRLALNVPLDITKGFLPSYAEAVLAAENARWAYRSTIIWNEDNISKSVARGSIDSANSPHVITRVEMIALFYKEDWNKGRKGKTMERQEWLEWTNGMWNIPGETKPWEGFPAAFPLEIPHRLIKLLSFPEDVVMDPFAGSFTSGVAARELGRHFVGIDIFQDNVDSGRRRLGL